MIIFIFGEDDFRGKQKVRELKDKFLRDVDPGGNSLSVIDGSTTTMKEINEKVGTSSLLSSKRMVVIEDLFSNSSILEEAKNYFYQKEKEEDKVLVFWEPGIKTKKKGGGKQVVTWDSSGREKPLTKKASEFFTFLNKQQYVQEFPLLSRAGIAKWAQEKIEDQGLSISNRALQLLVGLTGGDLWQLQEEINKLVAYKKGNNSQEIEYQDVKMMVSGMFTDNIFALTDALSNKNSAEAVRLLEEQMESGANEHYLLTMIIRQIRILLQIRQALDKGHSSQQIAKQLKLHPFIVQKGVNQVKGFDLEKLKKALNELIEIDKALKSGQGEAKSLLDLFILLNC